MQDDKPILSVKGLVGWTVYGTHTTGTYSSGPHDEPHPDTIAIDVSERLASSPHPVSDVWRRPSLDLSLPPGNVRDLFEGCIGHEGSTQGHAWDGDIHALKSMGSVGLDVYVAILRAYVDGQWPKPTDGP